MRSVFRSVLVALVAVLALGAVMTASASAASHEFYVEGKALSESALVEGTGSHATVMWESGGVELPIECTTSRLRSSLEGGGRSIGELKLEHCTVLEPVNCAVREPVVLELVGQLSAPPSATIDTFTGSKSHEGAGELGYTNDGGTCALNGQIFTVAGSFTCQLPSIALEAETHEVACKEAESHLRIGNNRLTIETTIPAKMTGKKWSAK